MASSSWTYYAEEIATGREDYHALSAERPGIFLGAGAEALGITDVAVDTTALERLFGHGEDPRDGTALGRRFADDERTAAGFALTFSLPKSVSVIWALADDDLSAAVLGGHDTAVRSALWISRDPCRLHSARARWSAPGRHRGSRSGELRPSDLTGRRPAAAHAFSSPTRCVWWMGTGSASTPVSCSHPSRWPACSTRRRFGPNSRHDSASPGQQRTTTASPRSRVCPPNSQTRGRRDESR